MQNVLPDPADGYTQRHIRKMRWRRVVMILSCIVVFCTTYALIMPAVTMSHTACGKEEHVHSDACYDENGALICGKEEHTHTDACLLAVRELTYEDGDLTLSLRVESMDALPEDLTLSVEQPQAAVQSAAAEGGRQTFTRRVTLLSQGQEVDTSSYAMTATVQVKPQALTALESQLTRLQQESAESDTGISLTLNQTSGQEDRQLTEALMELGGDIPAVTADVRSGTITVQAESTANPHYTVEYYANIPRFAESGSNPLTVIDTSGNGDGSGGNLPKNLEILKTKSIYLESAGGSTDKNNGNATPLYRVKTQTTLTQMYTDNQFEYIKSPNPSYINKLIDAPSYTLAELWVLKDGRSGGSMDRNDWDIYTDPGNVHFTNRKDVTGINVVYIHDQTVIRLVYDTRTSSEQLPANFYDYDISSGKNGNGDWSTGITGINSEANYETSRAHGQTWKSHANVLAFGNDNTGTGMSRYMFDGVFLNKYSTHYIPEGASGSVYVPGASKDTEQYGCTFEIADSLASDGTIVYNEWIVAPKLFNEGDSTGKTNYTAADGSSLTFSRMGDTYTLSSATVGGVGNVGDLQYFFNPSPNTNTNYSWIFTNDFWPLDGASQKTDPNFGSYDSDKRVYYQGFQPYTYDGTTEGGSWRDQRASFPFSDDGNNHNCFFGMQYAVKFTLTADYVGPLEYYFFGDDDMWVFLDNTLVCDIGGVHSSVGEYVNLWDYLKKGDAGEHTLTFFYTERGASGSTCYMNFTLPSVSGVNIEQKTSDLEVRKQVLGEDDPNKEFDFTIRFYDQNGSEILDDYAYTRYDKDGNAVGEPQLVVHTGDNFRLKNGEYIRVKYLPFGLRYTITETGTDGYTVTNTVDGVIRNGSEATGTILNTGQMNQVLFTNTMISHDLTLQKQDMDGNALTGAVFQLTDKNGNTVSVVRNDDGSYTVPATATDLIKDRELYYIASAQDEDWVIQQDTGVSTFDAKLQKKSNSAYQKFRVYRQDDGSYSFYCEANQKWLDLDAAGLENGHLVHFWTNETMPTTHDNQKWYITVTDTGLKIKPRMAVLNKSNAVLDLNTGTPSQGQRIQVYEDNGTIAQRWKLVPVDPENTPSPTNDLAVNDKGQLTIKGLLPGTYTLRETKKPAGGYQDLTPTTIRVAADGTVTVVEGSGLVTAQGPVVTVRNRPTDKTLTLRKEVVGPVKEGQKFSFTVSYVDEATGEKITRELKLADGGSDKLSIPYGAEVTITEPSHPGYALTFREGNTTLTNLDDNSYRFVIKSDVTITAVNTAGYELPDTGGPGVVWYTTGGVLLMTAAVLLLYKNRNRRKGGHLLS